MRNSGLAHLLAISGLHIGLVASILFVAVRGLLALVEPLALRHPIKKWAASVALAGAFGYLLLTGATVPTQRAFLMVALVLVAVLTDRSAFSMRTVALAAMAILVLRPESLLSVSFQMSFAAVVALIATYETLGARFAGWRRSAAWPRRVLLYLLGVGLTTVVASLATMPFAAYHFNQVAHYGLAANLLAVPLTALWIMPWGVATYVLLPFGLEALALAPMGWGIEAVVGIAETVAAWSGSISRLVAPAPAALALVSLGGLWLCLWVGRWRLWGVAAICDGLLIGLAARPPDILIDGRGDVAEVRDGAGGLRLSSARANGFRTETWLRRLSVPARWPTAPGATGWAVRGGCGGARFPSFATAGRWRRNAAWPISCWRGCRCADAVLPPAWSSTASISGARARTRSGSTKTRSG